MFSVHQFYRAQEEVQRMLNGLFHLHLRLPVQAAFGVADARFAMLNVLIALAVVVAAFHFAEAGKRREAIAQRMAFEAGQQHLRQLFDARFVIRVTDVDDLPVAAAVFVLDDAEQRFDTVADVSKAALLLTAFDELDRRAFHQVEDQLGDGAGAADTRGVEVIQTRPHPVERTEQGELQAILIAVGPDHAVQQLLGDRVDPALFVDRPDHQVGSIFVEVFVGAHAVHFRGRREDDALIVFHAIADDLQVLFEIQLEHAQRVAGVLNRCGNRHQRQHHVAFLDVVFDPLRVDADVPFNEVEARITEETADRVGSNVQTVDLVVVVFQQAL
ncbi:hypothetical protein COLO4_04188, partial [Corchorus olitorius]